MHTVAPTTPAIFSLPDRRNIVVAQPFKGWRSELEVDVISLIARRSGVDPITVKHQLSAWSIGEMR